MQSRNYAFEITPPNHSAQQPCLECSSKLFCKTIGIMAMGEFAKMLKYTFFIYATEFECGLQPPLNNQQRAVWCSHSQSTLATTEKSSVVCLITSEHEADRDQAGSTHLGLFYTHCTDKRSLSFILTILIFYMCNVCKITLNEYYLQWILLDLCPLQTD